MKTQIALNEMEFYAYHGYYAEERQIGTTFLVSVTLDVDFSAAERSDELTDTLNYELVYNVVRQEMETPSKLLEHVAYRLREALTTHFPTVTHASVTVTKLNPPLGGKVKSASVTIG